MKKIISSLLLVVMIAGLLAPMALAENNYLKYTVTEEKVLLGEDGKGSFQITIDDPEEYGRPKDYAGVQYAVRLSKGVEICSVTYSNPKIINPISPQADSLGDFYFSTGFVTENLYSGPLTCTINISYTGTDKTKIEILDIKQIIINNTDHEVSTITSKSAFSVWLIPFVFNDDATLADLSIQGVTLTPQFSPDIYVYNAKVAYKTESIIVNATKNHNGARVEGDGYHTLSVGNNTIDVTVTPENGVKKTYKIIVYRESPSTDATLVDLSIQGVTLDPSFSPDVFTYAADVTYGVTSVTIKAITNDEKANVSLKDNYTLDVGENKIVVIVTAEDGSTKEYTIVIFRRSASSGAPNTSLPVTADGIIEEVTEQETPLAAMFPFTDVKESDWFYENVLYMFEKELMNGMTEVLFAPNGFVTRGMVVTVLYRIEGEPDVSGTDIPFDDVAEGIYYTAAVKWAAAHEIILGYGDGRVGPGDKVTREQLAAILYRYQQYADNIPPDVAESREFADDDSISDYAKAPVNKLVMQGIINGKPNNLFDPKGNATRAEYAAMLHRLLDR